MTPQDAQVVLLRPFAAADELPSDMRALLQLLAEVAEAERRPAGG